MADLHDVAQNCPAVHGVPQAPQCRQSRFVSAQWFPQHSKPVGQSGLVVQVARHWPVEHTRPAAHSRSVRQLEQSCVARHLPLAHAASFLQPGMQVNCGPQYLPAGHASFAPGVHSTQV